MKQLIVVLCVVGFLVALPLSHVAADGPAAEVEICHIAPNDTPSEPFMFFNEVVASYGHIISVSGNAAQAHYAHGDPELVFLTEDFAAFIPEFIDGFGNDSECVSFVLIACG
jgi:hypothetical protein